MSFQVDAGDQAAAQLSVFDAQGRLVRRLSVARSDQGQSVSWDGRNSSGAQVPSGVYFTRLQTPAGTSTQKIVRIAR
ncbi:MAG: hypothetical protein DHS20C21_13870 [Gemmatimonadota bacterium]|nr:MAG: hypothetical protein DHS20C21_13870 [Gemmatimonadota bacterium]